MQVESVFYHACVKNENCFPERKSFCFLARSHKLHPSLPKGSTWHFIEIKAIKQDYNSSIIMWTEKNSKGKYWVVSQQVLFFNAF